MKKPSVVDVALELGMTLGEGVFWDRARGALVWVDILVGEIHELAGSVHRIHRTDTHIGVAAPRSRGGWVLAVREGFGAYDPDAGRFDILKRIEVPGTRMNDGNVDRRGRFFAGSMLYTEERGGGRLLCEGARRHRTDKRDAGDQDRKLLQVSGSFERMGDARG